jgi:SAM-dependent methyltransferase
MRHKNPEVAAWLDAIVQRTAPEVDEAQVHAAERAILRSINDLLVYAFDPALYDRLPFTHWDDSVLTGMVDFRGRVVVDVGAGTGRLSLVAAPLARVVYCVEPVENLRRFIREKARACGLDNIYALDGLITAIPFEDGFADICMGGHVFGDQPEQEYAEMARITRPGGWVVFCPGTNLTSEDEAHRFLVQQGFSVATFEEPGDGLKRKYWKQV